MFIPLDHVKEVTSEKEEGKSEMEEKEDEVKPINWYNSGLYIPLLSEKDCSAEPTVRAATGHHTAADTKRLPLQQQLAS